MSRGDTYIGRPCASGHRVRYRSNRKCVECKRARENQQYHNLTAEQKRTLMQRQREYVQAKKETGPVIRVSAAGWGCRV